MVKVHKWISNKLRPADYREAQLEAIVQVLLGKGFIQLSQEALEKLADTNIDIEERLATLKAELERITKQVSTVETEKSIIDHQFNSIKAYVDSKIST